MLPDLQAIFQEHKGLCYWCSRECIMPHRHFEGRPTPGNLATRDHVYSKLNPNTDRAKRDEIVLACFHCNQRRNNEEICQYKERHTAQSKLGIRRLDRRCACKMRIRDSNTIQTLNPVLPTTFRMPSADTQQEHTNA